MNIRVDPCQHEADDFLDLWNDGMVFPVWRLGERFGRVKVCKRCRCLFVDED